MTICLNMIVKNEAHVIERCLSRVKPFISSWAILDTGSTDNTPELVRRALKGVPGVFAEHEWQGFAGSRNRALDLARQSKADYILFLDADAEFQAPEGWSPSLDSDALHLRHVLGDYEYWKPILVRASLPWRWKAQIHEYLDLAPGFSCRKLEGAWVHERHEGARSKDPNTHAKDAILLEGMDLTDTRNVFYLAQSYGDSGQWDKALQMYLKRAAMGGWDEEIYFSILQTARIMAWKNYPKEFVIMTYLLAYEARPSRAEPLGYLADFLAASMPKTGRMFADLCKQKPIPTQDLLYIERKFYGENK